jgi:hypothetical protein
MFRKAWSKDRSLGTATGYACAISQGSCILGGMQGRVQERQTMRGVA